MCQSQGCCGLQSRVKTEPEAILHLCRQLQCSLWMERGLPMTSSRSRSTREVPDSECSIPAILTPLSALTIFCESWRERRSTSSARLNMLRLGHAQLWLAD